MHDLCPYNRRMRTIILLAMLMAFGARAQGVPDAFEITQRYADQNAPQLALARVEQMQPAAMNAPRCNILVCTFSRSLNGRLPATAWYSTFRP